MSIIYEPRGKAREYSPLAVNLYSGCGHKCSYCYVPNVLQIDRKKFDNEVSARPEILKKLESDCKKFAYSKKQVLMSFTTDPYNPIENELHYTRQALKLFLKYKIPVAILTKSGKACLKDMDIFTKFEEHIKIGASLTYLDPEQSSKVEKGAALPFERLEALKTLHDNGIKTWVSFEPILNPNDVLELLSLSIEYVDEYQFGKLSGDKRQIDWNYWVLKYIELLRKNGKKFYIKETLRYSCNKIKLNPEEYDLDYLNLTPFERYDLF